jgi:alkylation response protein AidB-like acyl-CoA dehydrogenase
MLHSTTFGWWSPDEVALATEVNAFADSLRERNMAAMWSHDVPRDIIEELGRRGYFGAVIPQAYGGMSPGSGDATRLSIIMEGLGRIPGATMAFGVGCAFHISQHGTEDQKRHWLPGLAAGTTLGAVAVTEPYAGSDAGGIATFARPTSGGYLLNGRKRYITHTGLADVYLVYAATSTDPAAVKKRTHLSAFLVPADSPRLNVERLYDLGGSQYLRNGVLHFDDVFLTEDAMLGAPGDGWAVMTGGLNVERVAVACKCIGMMGESLATSWQWLRRRWQFGASLDRLATIRARMGTALAEGISVRTTAYHAAHLLDIGAEGSGLEASAAKLLAAETSLRVASTALELMGADGYSRHYPVFQIMQDLRLYQVGAGSNDVLRGLIFRLGEKRFDEVLAEEPLAILPPTLTPAVADPISDSLTDTILRVLAESYRLHPGLHLTLADLRRRLPDVNVDAPEFAAAVDTLEGKDFVSVARRGEDVIGLRPTYTGLDAARDSDYFRLIPDWATDLH